MLNIGKKLFSMYQSHTAPTTNGPPPSSHPDPQALLSQMSSAIEGDNKWKLTNIGGIGSDTDKQIREEAATSEEAFQGAGTSPGLEIWRIEKFEPEKIEPRVGNLSLYSGDCYIVLKTTEKDDGSMDWQLHYWIGKDSTQDESGSAAYFTVNLDDLLDQKPVQHREVQYSESALFHSYFGSVTYLDGGIDSGFKKAEPEVYQPRLLQMATMGDTVRVLQVPLSANSLNNGDVFILDNGMTIYQFIAPEADFKERTRAMEIVEQDIRAERDGEPDVVYIDGEEVFDCEPFWELLGGKIDSLPDADNDRDFDSSDEVGMAGVKKLLRISDEDGSLVMSLEKESENLSEADINDDDAWVVATGTQCFIYMGAAVSRDEKFYVWNNCAAILAAADLDSAAPTTFISRDSDPDTWAKLFG